MNTKIIGRKEELELLQEVLDSKNPEFVAIYGRRRVGKTFLIKQFSEHKAKYFFNVTGIRNGKLLEQIHRFVLQIGEVFYNGVNLKTQKIGLIRLMRCAQPSISLLLKMKK